MAAIPDPESGLRVDAGPTGTVFEAVFGSGRTPQPGIAVRLIDKFAMRIGRLICGLVCGFATVCMTASDGPRLIQAEAFGLHVNRPEHWPEVSVAAIRPANVAWRTINSAPGKFDWSLLDAWVDRAAKEKAEIGYVFLGTPQWAASQPTESCYAGPIGCGSVPRDWRDWETFVTAVVERYRGKIKSYELWNEPNNPQFWTSSIEQMVELTNRAGKIIRSIDPAAIIVSPSPTYVKTGPPQIWLKQFLAAGGGKYAQVIGFHGYIGGRAESVVSVVLGVKTAAQQAGFTGTPIWNTESSWGRDSSIEKAADQQAFLVRSYVLQLSLGVERFYWYQWDNTNWGTLWDATSGLRPPGQSFRTVRSWLEGAEFTHPCAEISPKLWECTLTRGSTPFKISWNEATATTECFLTTISQSAQRQPGDAIKKECLDGTPFPVSDQTLRHAAIIGH
jgi:hypothetical protein